MKAIVVTDQAAGTAGMTLMERPRPQAAINDVVVQIHASGFGPTELAWPSTWTDRRDRGRTPSILGHDLAGVVTALGYGTTGLSVGQRVFGLADWYRDGTLAEYVAIEARNLAPLPGDVDFTVGASLPISGLTAWQGLFQHGRLEAGQSVLAHGAAGAVGSMVTQLAREAGAYVIGTGRTADRQTVLDFGAKEFVDLDNDALEDVGEVDLVFDVIGGDIGKRSAGLIRAGGTLVSIVGPPEARPADGLAVDFVVESDRAQLSEIVQRVRDGRLRTNIGNVSTLDDAVAALNPTKRRKGIDNHPRSSVSDMRLSMHAAGRRCPHRPTASYQTRRGNLGTYPGLSALAARSLGLGSTPLIGFDAEAVAREFGLAENAVPVMLLSVGAERPGNWPQKPRRPVVGVLDLV